MYLTKSYRSAFPVAAILLALVAALVFAPGSASAAQDANGSASVSLVAAQAEQPPAAADNAKDPAYGVSLKVRANVEGKGWKKTVKAGKTAGTTGKKGLRAIKVSLTGNEGLSGNIKYRTYVKGKGWRKTVKNGKSTGATKRDVQAVKIWLTGEVGKNYDVLYRVYIKGHGWQPWVKNKAKAGITKSGYRVGAVQVKLSPKTQAAAGGNVQDASVFYEARMADSGWLAWKANGKTAGKTKDKVMDGLALSVNAGSIGGGVKYRAYIQGKKWKQGWKSDGDVTGVASKRIEALKIKLTGAIAETHDIYYRTFVPRYGWLDWASNGAESGGAGFGLAVSAFQVKLVKKGEPAPGPTADTTIATKKKELDGIDISSHQAGIVIGNVPGDFVIVKATGGKGYTNPFFRQMANATLKSGKLLGLYHFALDGSYQGTAVQEADHFVDAVGPYVGKAILVLDWETDALLLGPSWAKKFLDRVYEKTGVRPLIYMSKNPTREGNWSSVAKNHKLWVAQYPNYNATGYQSNPWTDSYGYGAWSAPTIFQYSSSGRLSGYSGYLDLDKFYGTRNDWAALAAKS